MLKQTCESTVLFVISHFLHNKIKRFILVSFKHHERKSKLFKRTKMSTLSFKRAVFNRTKFCDRCTVFCIILHSTF